MIVAYLILAHAKPVQLARLVAALPETSPILIHIDARAPAAIDAEARARLSSHGNVRFVERHACRWGDAGIVRATLALMRALVASGAPFDYATLISGADYPIKSNQEIARFLSERRGAEFIESFSMIEPNRWSGHGGLYRAPNKILQLHLRFRSRVMRVPVWRRLPGGLHPYGGGQWWTLTRGAIDHVVGYVADHPAILRFMRGVFIPDECFVQTVLSNSRFARNIDGDDLRLVIWDRPQPPYPANLTSGDLDLMADSPKLFARKFDIDRDPHVYRLIDEELRRELV